MRFPLPALCFFVLCCAVTGWLVGGAVPAGVRDLQLHGQDFRLAPKADKPVEVTEARWLFLPFLFGDFDLQMDVELAAGTDLDVLVRQVEPRLVQDQLLPFTGRFAVLRLTSGKEGPGWKTRDEALLGPRQGGVGLAPGMAATVWIEGRGRQLTANVAGKAQGSLLATDDHGMLTLVARGGKAVLHSLTIKVREQNRLWWTRWTWAGLGAVGGLLVGLLGVVRRQSTSWFVVFSLPTMLLAWAVLRRADLDLASPPPLALALMLGGCLLVPVAALGNVLVKVLVVIAAGVLLQEGDRRMRHDTRAVDAVFGPDAGAQPSEAHAQLVRGPGGLHDLGEAGKKVFLLGGQLLYDRGQPAEHLELLLGRELRAATRQPIVVPCAPTIDGHVAQQWRLFETCYTAYRPAVLVLGVPRDELASDAATGQPRSSAAQVRATIDEAQRWCQANGSQLVVFADRLLPDDLLPVVRDIAAAGVKVVTDVDGSGPLDVARRLAAAIVPLLQP